VKPVRGIAPVPSARHIPELDGLRGIAILMVMLGHFWLGAQPSDVAERALYTVVQNGWVGVDLFFVLSGFLITGILLDTKDNPRYFRNFYARRALRIFPLYYGFLFVWFIVTPRVFDISATGPFGDGSDRQLWFWAYLSNYLSLIKGAIVPHGLNHFWTLAIEEQFYLVWPALVLLASRKTLRTVCLLMIPASLAFRLWLMTTDYAHTGGYVLTPARVGTLAIGAWLASAIREPVWRKRIERFAPVGFFVSAILLIAINFPDFRMQGFEPAMQIFGFPLLAILSASALAIALDNRYRKSWHQKLLRRWELRFFGKYSYGMYVFHLPVIVAFEAIGFSIAAFPKTGNTDVPAAFLFTSIALGVTIALAYASWHLYEKQFLKLKRRFV